MCTSIQKCISEFHSYQHFTCSSFHIQTDYLNSMLKPRECMLDVSKLRKKVIFTSIRTQLCLKHNLQFSNLNIKQHFFLPVIVWLKAHENETTKAQENKSVLFLRHLFFRNSTLKVFWNISEICLTFVLASCLIFNIETFTKACLGTLESTSSLSLSFQYVITGRVTTSSVFTICNICTVFILQK